MCPVVGPPPGAACIRKKQSNRDDRNAEPLPSAPGQTTAALEAPAGCLRAHLRGPGCPGGLGHLGAPAVPTAEPSTRGCPAHRHRRARTHLHLLDQQHDHGADHRASPPTASQDTKPSTASQPITMAGRRTGADTPVPSGTTATSRRSALGSAEATTQPSVTAPSTSSEPTTTAPTTTAVSPTTEPTTTLLTTTSAEPTTTGPTTTSTGPTTSTEPTTTGSATTTTWPMILGGSQPAGVSAATIWGVLPLLGLLYLLRERLPRPGGAHAKRRRTNRLRRD